MKGVGTGTVHREDGSPGVGTMCSGYTKESPPDQRLEWNRTDLQGMGYETFRSLYEEKFTRSGRGVVVRQIFILTWFCRST